jgi:glutamine transport system substrate-binding protein
VVIVARLAAAVLGALVAAAVATAAVPTRSPGELVIALSMPAEGLQAGSVNGTHVVYARGLEVDLGRALARRLGLRRVRFVQVPELGIVRPGRKTWDIALAQIVPTPLRARAVELVGPYLVDDQAVLLRRGLARPHSLADIRRLQLCAIRGTRGADVAAHRARPTSRTMLARDIAEMLRWVQTGRCDAAIHDAPLLAASIVHAPGRYGRLAARIETGATYAIALPQGSPLAAAVAGALATLRASGATARLARAWLGVDPAHLPVLR